MINEVLEWFALGVDLVGVAIMMIGFLIALVRFVPQLFGGDGGLHEVHMIRYHLGTYLVFALEMMIVSDLITSVMSHRIEDLYFLAALVAIRTAISFFLNKEIQEIAHEHADERTVASGGI